ncbi:MAG TPA: glycosyltransferase [Gemmatimonadaceae bacterium]|nr:glycosyltransferase [Gemmatimonadaceae bacterium]
MSERPAAAVRPTGEVGRQVTPHVAAWREHLIHTVAVIAIVYATYWIYWRWTNTINTDARAIAPSLLLMLAETWAYVNMCLFVFLVWRLKERDPGPPLEGRTVDVWITCFDEPLEVLRRTAMGARAISYPHRTYMLDDGRRDEVRAMAGELGIGYIRRVANNNAKAGNLNFALGVTSGEFILQLDSDHVPLPGIVERMLGYFRDPKMAMVQTPQDFYNVDSFTHVVNDEGRRLWEENRIFYSLIQPGRDHWNASFFCGSCGLIRREALEAIGGFHSQSIIEDMETTIELHAAGWRTAYHNETLAYGLAPGNASAYHVQRLRWGQGAMQILRKLKPLTRSDLTLPQRINYFAGTAAYFEGWQKAVFYVMPLFFFFTGILPVSVNETEFVIRLIPYVVLMVLAFELLSRGTGYILLSERFTMVRFFTYMMAAFALFTKKPLKFHVTPKGRSSVPFRTYAPQLVLLVLSVAAPIWATVAFHTGWINYASSGWGGWSFWLNGFWALWNCYFAASVVRHSLVMRQQRRDHRFIDQLPVQVRAEPGGRSATFPAMTADLNPYGLRFRSTERLDTGVSVAIQLPLAGGKVWTAGEIRHVSIEKTRMGRVYSHGVAFGTMPIEVRDAIELHCTQHAVPMWRLRYRQSIDIVTRASEVMRNTRRERRRLVRLPAHVDVELDGGAEKIRLPEMFIVEDLSPSGAQLIGNLPITPGTKVSFDVPGAAITEAGIIRHVRALKTPMAVLYAMGVELNTDVPRAAELVKPADSGKAADAGGTGAVG